MSRHELEIMKSVLVVKSRVTNMCWGRDVIVRMVGVRCYIKVRLSGRAFLVKISLIGRE